MKKSKIIGLSTTIFFSLSAGAFVPLINHVSSLNTSKIETVSTTSQDSEVKYPLVPAQSNGQNSFLSTKTGPLVYWDNKITSLDWFGAERWHINMDEYISIPTNGSNWNRAWYNWDYDRTRNILWVLGFQYSQNVPQTIFSFNADTGDFINKFEITNDVDTNYKRSDYRFISALSSGKVLVYGGSKLPSYDGTAILFDPKTGKGTKLNGNSGKIPKPNDHNDTSKMYLFNIIPIAENRNIVEYVNFDNKSSNGTVDDGSKDLASYNVYFTLVDDNLDMVVNNNNKQDKWHQSVLAVEGVQGYRNTKITPQRDYYFLLDGRVVTILYNTVVIINPNDLTVSSETSTKVSFQTYSLDPTKWVLSWTFDTNENLFFKYQQDDKVFRVKSSELKNNGFNSVKYGVSPSTYYNIAGSTTEEAKKYAKDFILYNVYGYSGQIMLINAWFNERINIADSPKGDAITQGQYGLAFAVTENPRDPQSGDTKGLLNGENSFQKSADFTINPEILKSKLPSEITKNDITITNNGFFTTNSTKDDKGNLMYVPFEITEIDDTKGTFKIIANIDQIPWFANKLPSDSVPKKIEHTFSGAQQITSKVSWKGQETLSYDFKNMTPDELTVKDVQDFDPFQVSFSSQTIMNSNGNTLYPKKTYSIQTRENTEGKVTIKVDYQYVPQGVTYKDSSSVKTYSTTQQYTIFKSTEEKEFYFAGSNSQATETSTKDIDIKTVPQLKSLSESNLLPSSFSGKNQSDFLQFINTNKSKGYPVSRMTFKVEPDDTNGTLTVIASNANGQTFKQKYTGFNKTNQYSFAFTSATSINNKEFSTMLPSSVNEGDIIDNLVNYSGFNSSDFTVNLYPNDAEGTLGVDIVLNKNYAESLGNSSGFTSYKATKTFEGFMTTDQYNGKYNVTFKDDSNSSLLDIKRNTLDSIYSQITDKNTGKIKSDEKISVNGKEYTNLNDLIEKVFLESKGQDIPKGWATKTNQIKTNMAIDNQAGTMNLSISISQSLLNGYGSDLNYVVSYSGFARGNINPTGDSLTFVDNNLLSAVLPEDVMKMTPSQMKEWLLDKDNGKNNLRKIIFNATGQYDTFLNNGNYELDIQTNDAYKTISITLTFTGNLDNGNSLKEYSIQYKL